MSTGKPARSTPAPNHPVQNNPALPNPLLDRETLLRAFRLLGDGLARRGVLADLYVFGGAAMALAFDNRRTTRDVDATFHPHGIVTQEAARVARDLNLPPWWLNEQASVYVAGNDADSTCVFDHPGLRVMAASARHLLAMKVLAGRARDGQDIARLVQELGLTTTEQVLALVEEVFPEEPVPQRGVLLVDSVFDS